MIWKNFAVVFALLFFTTSCFAQIFYVMDSHVIEIRVDAEGNTEIMERYFLSFQNENQKVNFREEVNQIGISIDGWNEYDNRIYPRIGQPADISVQGISFIEDPAALDFLEITYNLETPIMEKKLETSRVIEYSLKPKFLNEFTEGSLWLIPEGTSIIGVKPDASIEGNTVVWNGYVSGNELFLEYSHFKNITSFDLNQSIQDLMQSDIFLFVVAIVAIGLIIVFAKRKTIETKIEEYIVENSEFHPEEE